MKALVLCAGKGTRLRPITHSTPKHLIPVANRAIISYVLQQISDANISEVGIVISPDSGGVIREVVGNGSQWGLEVSYVVQETPGGLAHAVKIARNFLKDADFLMFLGDNLIEGGVSPIVDEFVSRRPHGLVVLKAVDDPRRFGVAELDQSGAVTRLVEKPKEPKSNLAMVGAYVFTADIHEAIDGIGPSWRGELEITDAIQRMLDMGKVVASHVLDADSWWSDAGTMTDILEANRVLLDAGAKRQGTDVVRGLGVVENDVASDVKMSQCELVEPVSVASGCVLRECRVGPHVSLGEGVSVNGATIANSIVMAGAEISGAVSLRDSILGARSHVTASGEKVSSTLFIGDDCSVLMGQAKRDAVQGS